MGVIEDLDNTQKESKMDLSSQQHQQMLYTFPQNLSSGLREEASHHVRGASGELSDDNREVYS